MTTITCIDSNSGILNNIKPIIGWAAVALAVAAVAFYVIAPHILLHGIQHFIQTINQVKYMPYYIGVGAFGLSSMGIIAIIQSIKYKNKLIFNINNEEIIIPKKIKHDVKKINQHFNTLENIDESYEFAMKRVQEEEAKKIQSKIASISDENIQKKLKFIFSNDQYIQALILLSLLPALKKSTHLFQSLHVKFQHEFDETTINDEGTKVEMKKTFIIQQGEENPIKYIKSTQIIILDASEFKYVETNFTTIK